MRTVLIGHRGVGKSSLLKRVRAYFEEAGKSIQTFDLDREVEARSEKRIHDIFASEGEEAFREWERKTFREFDEASFDSDVFIAMGAGFDPALIPDTWRVVWVRRVSDEGGRIFTDRPRLNARVPAIEEFRERYHRRHAAYRDRADETLWIDEGQEESDEAERDFFLNQFRNLGGALTILPEQFRSLRFLERWARTRVEWGIRWFELRDDLLSEDQIDEAIRVLPDEKILISFRDPSRTESTWRRIENFGLAFDWPLERGPCDLGEPRYISLHERKEGESLLQALKKFPAQASGGSQFKAALPVHNFSELSEAAVWQESDAASRIFLPMSNDGRWAWFRLMKGESYSLNFIRESDGSSKEQPTLLQWARRVRLKSHSFAAVLGDPVSHSRTPMEQKKFFAQQSVPVFSIRVTEDEFRAGALTDLKGFGLRWAAVTAPLKVLAFEACASVDEASRELHSVNTLIWENGWRGANTDLIGFQKTIDLNRETTSWKDIAVWGGGGTLNVVTRVLPSAKLFSLRTGESRSGNVKAAEVHPDLVVWAVGSSRLSAGEAPPANWKPLLVVDLNYAEDSPGRAFALERGARYVSGLAMFQAQAESQREFWKGMNK